MEPDERLHRLAQEMVRAQLGRGVLDAWVTIDRPVDVVLSSHTPEHVADLESFMTGMKRILHAGGYLCTVVPTYRENCSCLSRGWLNSARYSLFTPRSLDQLLAPLGLEQVHHTFRGWLKEIDEFWHVARYTGACRPREELFEDPLEVKHYLDVTNPFRTLVYLPLLSHLPLRRRLVSAVSLLVTSPREFSRRAGALARTALLRSRDDLA